MHMVTLGIFYQLLLFDFLVTLSCEPFSFYLIIRYDFWAGSIYFLQIYSSGSKYFKYWHWVSFF